MSHVPHELAEEFPDAKDLIHDLKLRDPRFAELAAAYHVINRLIHRAETRIEPVSDAAEEAMRRERLRLKDEIAAALRVNT